MHLTEIRRRVEQMQKDIDYYFQIWLACNQFDPMITDEKIKKQYFQKTFKRIAANFIQKKTQPSESDLSLFETADRFMTYCQHFDNRRKSAEQVVQTLFPKKYIIGKLAKYMESPEDYQNQIEEFEKKLVSRKAHSQAPH